MNNFSCLHIIIKIKCCFFFHILTISLMSEMKVSTHKRSFKQQLMIKLYVNFSKLLFQVLILLRKKCSGSNYKVLPIKLL